MGGIQEYLTGKQPVSRGHATFGLTQLGKSKASQYSGATPEATVLCALDTIGMGTIQEIAGECRYPPQRVNLILKSLEKRGWVRTLGRDG